MVTEPRGALMCRSLTLAVLADFGPFIGLLLTNLVSQSDFYGCLSPRCAYVSFINTRHFMVTEPQCALSCRSLTLTILADFGPFRGLLLTILGF